MQKPLTDVLVCGLAPPPSGRLEITDTRCPGLAIRVTSGGAKSWSFLFRDPQTAAVSRVTIGSYPDVSLSEAREWAVALRKTVAAGQNPNDMKRQTREEATTKTFEALAERYLRKYANGSSALRPPASGTSGFMCCRGGARDATTRSTAAM